jgi:hypothetical protein
MNQKELEELEKKLSALLQAKYLEIDRIMTKLAEIRKLLKP